VHTLLPQVGIAVFKTTSSNPATGTSDGTFINYSGGECDGPEFEKAGATEVSRGTFHSVASENGNRIDTVVTSLTDSAGDIGPFSLTGFGLNQNN
jgi:hypothetical protein